MYYTLSAEELYVVRNFFSLNSTDTQSHFFTPLPIIFHHIVRLTCECIIDFCVFNIRSDTLKVNICWSIKHHRNSSTIQLKNRRDRGCHWWSRNLSPSAEYAFTPNFSGVHVAQSLIFCIEFCISLFILFSFDHCVVFPSLLHLLLIP